MTAREAALRALLSTLEGGRFLDDALVLALEPLPAGRDRALARDLAYGVCRYWPRLRALRDGLLERPLKAKDADVGVVLALGLYQLLYSRVADHAAVAESVSLCTALRKRWASGLVNAVLRRFQREREARLRQADEQPSARFAHPSWLLERLRRDWPHDWQRIVDANNTQAPMTLRVNRRLHSRDTALAALLAGGVAARPTTFSPDGIVLERPRDVSLLPGFEDGALSVQDEAAQLAVALLAPRAGERFLDACAAPGGKLAHVLEHTPDLGAAVAVERDAARAARTTDTLRRLGLAATLHVADVRDTDAWWDGVAFDCILLDAPCSATGVIRRHPDIKLNRSPADLESLPRAQAELLDALWPLLADGGRLLYATCSIMPAENAAVVSRFAGSRCDARLLECDVAWGVKASPGRQILPGDAGMDGFYYALLAKR